MDTREEREAPLMTLRRIRALAGKRGYRVIVDDTHLYVLNKSDEQIACSFDLRDPFRIDPLCTQQFILVRIYLWIRGYDLTYEEPPIVRIERARNHWAWNSRQSYVRQYVYKSLFLLFCDIAAWIQYLETHHCPLMEMLPIEEGALVDSSEHSIT